MRVYYLLEVRRILLASVQVYVRYLCVTHYRADTTYCDPFRVTSLIGYAGYNYMKEFVIEERKRTVQGLILAEEF